MPLPLDDIDENAAMVNAPQGHASIVTQKASPRDRAACPQQYAWGGVCTGYTRPVSDVDTGRLRSLRRPLTGSFLANSRVAYRRLAGRIANQIADYRRSGYTVESVVVVAGSPSCDDA